MAVSVAGAPDVTPSVVTITVHITLNGEELPPEASRLLSDLEALAASQATQQIQRNAPHPRTPGAQPPAPRNLRLVERGDGPASAEAPATAAPAGGTGDAKVRRIGRATPDAPSLYLCTGSRLVLQD